MTAPMLSGHAVRVIRRLQAANWQASQAIAEPARSVVLTRPGVGALPPQAVDVVWSRAKQAGAGHVSVGADDTPDRDLTLRRLIADGFDAKPGDTGEVDGQAFSIVRVRRDNGIIHAEARLVTGSVWP